VFVRFREPARIGRRLRAGVPEFFARNEHFERIAYSFQVLYATGVSSAPHSVLVGAIRRSRQTLQTQGKLPVTSSVANRTRFNGILQRPPCDSRASFQGYASCDERGRHSVSGRCACRVSASLTGIQWGTCRFSATLSVLRDVPIAENNRAQRLRAIHNRRNIVRDGLPCRLHRPERSFKG
jgi:hypothetical protein